MRVLMINSVCGIGSTGRICTDLARRLETEGHEVKIAYGRSGTVPEQDQKYGVRIGTALGVRLHGVESRLLDNHGLASKAATRRFLRWAEQYDPQMLWLHNLHGYYLNYEFLFEWIKGRPQMQVKWTLHDCWAFTGHCSYFTKAQCEQWKTHCLHCTQTRQYPASFALSNCDRNFDRKRAAFTNVPNMTLVTPSQWLASLVKQSFLKDYSVEICYNAINTYIFKPTPSDFRERYGLTEKRIILGVASVWNERKGLNDFFQLAQMLDEHYVIVLVGLSKKQMKKLPENIIGIPCTNSAEELAEIYTAADVFLNPTYEDNYPTVNLEAEACGNRVISYNTGGCKETLHRSDSLIIGIGELSKVVKSLQTMEEQDENCFSL